MKRINGKEVIEVTKFYDFVMSGIPVSAREVMDEVDDLYRECKCMKPDDFFLARKEVDESNPMKLKYTHFTLAETSHKFKAFAEVIIRYYLGRHDYDKARLCLYFGADVPGTKYLIDRGLIPEFDSEDSNIVHLSDLMAHYCEKLKEIKK